jgi:aconitate hydratase
MSKTPTAPSDVKNARVLAILGDSVTTDHISPAGAIKTDSPAGKYLIEHGIAVNDFNSYGARRGNHEVMMRGTFANIRIRNEMLSNVEGGFTKHFPEGAQLSIYDAAMEYKKTKTPLVIFAGKEYGTGSSRDWAAKGTLLLGVKAVIAESFERIHRSNLIGMGVLPLTFTNGTTRKTVKLDGSETIHISGIENGLQPGARLQLQITRSNGDIENIEVLCRIDTQNELNYYLHGGILQYVLRSLNT